MFDYAKSFADFIKREEDEKKTPIGRLRLKYIDLNPDLIFNWVNDIKCINGLDSYESMEWSKYIMKASLDLTDSIYDPILHRLDDLNGGSHILLAEWFYITAYNGYAYRHPEKLTTWQKEFRIRVLTKLTRNLKGFPMGIKEKESLCSYLLLRNSFMKYKDMFVPDKLLALKVINRFAREHEIRFEDAESVLRGYTYCI